MNEDNTLPEQSEKESPRLRKEVYEWLHSLVAALLFCVLFFVFIARIIGVIGTSMLPTLLDGDKVLVSNLFFTPERGDIVVLTVPTFSDKPLVKRVIATEGQTIDMDFDIGVVTVDGVALQEDYIAELTYTREDFQGPMTVPEGCVFVMGDNRNGSTDSRRSTIGMVDERNILGKVYFIVLPIRDFGYVY